jgi:hypothetical protein
MARVPTGVFVAVALAVAVGVGTAVAPFASAQPDGLERVARDEAFADTGRAHAVHASSPMPDYAFPGIGNERVATGLSGFVGTLGMFALMHVLALGLRRRARGGPHDGDPGPRPAPSG